MNAKKLKNIKSTDAWKSAEWDYDEIITSYQFPLLGERPTKETMARRMDEILKTYPHYFPALLYQGQLYIFEGKDELAIEVYDQGFEIMSILSTKKELIDTIDNFIDLLESELRFDIEQYFESIMHRFIFKHGDIDDEIFDDIYNSLILFYDFLCNHKLVGSEVYKEFVKNINAIKSKLRTKMHRYNKIRHDNSISEEQKEDIREELFEGDHMWPFL